MKILPHMSRVIVLAHEDGKTFEMAPFQVFIGASGMTCIRIGRNVLFFDENGIFDGTESNFCAGTDPESIQQAFELQGQCKGLAPETPYFPPGSPAFAAETRAWPSAKKERSGQNYAIVPKGPKLDS